MLHFKINILSSSLRELGLAIWNFARSRHSLTRIASWLARWNNFHRSKAVSCPSRELWLKDFMRPPTFCSINQDYAASIKTSCLELQPFISKLAWVTLARRKEEWYKERKKKPLTFLSLEHFNFQLLKVSQKPWEDTCIPSFTHTLFARSMSQHELASPSRRRRTNERFSGCTSALLSA